LFLNKISPHSFSLYQKWLYKNKNSQKKSQQLFPPSYRKDFSWVSLLILEILKRVLDCILELSIDKSATLPIKKSKVYSLEEGTMLSDRRYSNFCTVRENSIDSLYLEASLRLDTFSTLITVTNLEVKAKTANC
jgi:hypothetical protein